ncbi:MAG: hypothetical protein HY080_10605, partial [Gammaproteobacteria bacterium]|nr:hypothetical protein [Gammaproteobacteria bacterium]
MLHRNIASLLSGLVLYLGITASAWATSASITAAGTPLITVNASGSFSVYTLCDSNGQNCHDTDGSGSVSGYLDNGYVGGAGGIGSANYSWTVDAGHLSQGMHTFKAVASDYGASDTQTQTITIDNTPQVTISSPAGGPIEGAFNFTGSATFKPVASGNTGTVTLYVDSVWKTSKAFTTTTAPFDY